MEPPLGGFRLPLRYFQITSSSGRWERQARPVSWRELHDQTRGQDWGNPQKCARQGLLVLRQPKLSTRPSERKTVAGGKTFRTLQSMSAPSGDRRGPWPHPMDVGNHAVREDNYAYADITDSLHEEKAGETQTDTDRVANAFRERCGEAWSCRTPLL
jgi:hypothetical protein